MVQKKMPNVNTSLESNKVWVYQPFLSPENGSYALHESFETRMLYTIYEFQALKQLCGDMFWNKQDVI